MKKDLLLSLIIWLAIAGGIYVVVETIKNAPRVECTSQVCNEKKWCEENGGMYFTGSFYGRSGKSCQFKPESK